MRVESDERPVISCEEAAINEKMFIVINTYPFHIGSDSGIRDEKMDKFISFPLGVYPTRRKFNNAFNRVNKDYTAIQGYNNVIYFLRREHSENS